MRTVIQSRKRSAFRILLWALSRPQTFYILGAGVSCGLVPMALQMRSLIKKRYIDFGAYPASNSNRHMLHHRVIGRSPAGPFDL